jgi:ligand-binding sensor domain-containing protein/two-component sensor histidine kinase
MPILHWRKMKDCNAIPFLLLSLAIPLLMNTVVVNCEQLPLKTYTTADGLVHERVRRIVRDSHGFLWFCTGDGLSRFDGYTFTNYNSAQGLQQPAINDLIERRDGSYWLATNGGAILFNPFASTNKEKFKLYVVGDESKDLGVMTLYEDRAGRLWAGTSQGLFILDESNKQRVFRRNEVSNGEVHSGEVDGGELNVNRITEDAEGALWIATSNGLVRLVPDGRKIKYQFAASNKTPQAKSLVFDNENHLWVGYIGGLLILKPEPVAEIKSERHLITAGPQTIFDSKKNLALPEKAGTENWFVSPTVEARIWDVAKLSDGSIWIANRGTGIFKFQNGVLNGYTVEQGLTDNYVNVIEQDLAGNIWVGTETSGAIKISQHGFTAFRESDGMKRKYVREVFETNAGEIVAITNATEMSYLNNDLFVPLKVSIASDLIVAQTLGRETPFQDHLGEWWIAAKNGLYHYPKLENLEAFARAKPVAIYMEKEGLPNLDFVAINEDSRGDIWIGTAGKVLLTRWERATSKFYSYTEADGVPASLGPLGFAETPNGDVWFSFEEGGVLRYRAGSFRLFTQSDGIPAGVIPTLFSDSAGRLWIPSWRGGVVRVDNPAEDELKVETYTPSNGLASINARCVTEDKQGRIYIGTVRGVDRLEVESGRIKHYTVADGLSNSEIGTCFRDSRNTLWFATYRGLSKFVPEEAENALPSPTLISGLHVAGLALPVSELGTSHIEDLQFEPMQNQLQVDFFSLSFATGENLRYQYKLDGAQADWSAPTSERTVNFANLAAGDYRLKVRAINSSGKIGEAATVSFKILRPVWQRWWALLLAALFFVSIILLIERYRAARLRELRMAMSALRVSENRFRTMIEQSPLGTVIFKPDGSIRSVNKASENFWGVTYAQIADWKMLEDEQLIASGVAEYLKRGLNGEFVVIPPAPYDAKENNSLGAQVVLTKPLRWIQSFMYPVRDEDGQLREAVLVMEDITERMQAEETLRRTRRERFAELQKVRTRIATDLHDDIGSSLTQIAILSEVARQYLVVPDSPMSAPLVQITSVSNELVEAMSDIVWAINPRKDHLSDLTQRMRRLASDLFTARKIAFQFRAPDMEQANLNLGANIRREVFLIFKESINNIVRHSDCATASIEFRIEGDELSLRVSDDGKGFDVASVEAGVESGATLMKGGNGVPNIHRRATELGGTLEIISRRGHGTIVQLKVPHIASEPLK